MARCTRCGESYLTGVQYYAHECKRCPECRVFVADVALEKHLDEHLTEKPPPQSTAVIALPGDHIVFCTPYEPQTAEEAKECLERTGKLFPGCKVGMVFGISGVVVYRGGESNDRADSSSGDRAADDSG